MRRAYLVIGVITLTAFGCVKEYSGWNVYYNSKIDLVDIAANDECPNGGVMVKSGLDKNQNDKLDSAEVDQTKMICNGTNGSGSEPEPGPDYYDKQVIIQLDMLTANMSSATPIIIGEFPFFNKNNYPGVDSIVLVGRPYIWPGELNTATVELYNLTDDQVIANSTISTNKEWDAAGFVVSRNIYSSLPDKTISLGIRVYSQADGKSVATGPLYLYLHRP